MADLPATIKAVDVPPKKDLSSSVGKNRTIAGWDPMGGRDGFIGVTYGKVL
jgi:hypothetical protein